MTYSSTVELSKKEEAMGSNPLEREEDPQNKNERKPRMIFPQEAGEKPAIRDP